MSYTKVKAINEESEVGYDQNGNIILAERLSKWAFNQLYSAPDLLEACKRAAEHFEGTDAPLGKLLQETISKAEGREGK